MKKISRREFLKILYINMGVYAMRPFGLIFSANKPDQSSAGIENMPDEITRILDRVPMTEVDEEGYLQLVDEDGSLKGRVKLARTEWNKKHVTPKDKLHKHEEWGIVLHWFGDKDNHGLRLPGYLAGFD
ncbi:MAG: hypothetical protein N2C13_02585, partial [Chloroflexota bacterium]